MRESENISAVPPMTTNGADRNTAIVNNNATVSEHSRLLKIASGGSKSRKNNNKRGGNNQINVVQSTIPGSSGTNDINKNLAISMNQASADRAMDNKLDTKVGGKKRNKSKTKRTKRTKRKSIKNKKKSRKNKRK
jgi:hypothetical protein